MFHFDDCSNNCIVQGYYNSLSSAILDALIFVDTISAKPVCTMNTVNRVQFTLTECVTPIRISIYGGVPT